MQSNYIPWKGYFDLIASVDEFLLYDTVQYTRRDWRNRNRIKTAQGPRWLTIPVRTKGRYLQRVDEVEVGDPGWARRHWRSLVHHYTAADCFHLYRERFEDLYLGRPDSRLSDVNRRFLSAVCELLGITTPLRRLDEDGGEEDATARLVALCRRAGAGEYLSGPAARSYLDERRFTEAGISVSYMDYSGYPEHPRLHPPFEHSVTVLDLLFNAGTDSHRYMKAVDGS